MSISFNQIDSVLRTYDRQLKQDRINKDTKNADNSRDVVDHVTISSEAKKRQVIDRILSQAVERYTVKEQKQVFSDELAG